MSFKEDYISDETLTSLLIPKGASHYDLNKINLKYTQEKQKP